MQGNLEPLLYIANMKYLKFRKVDIYNFKRFILLKKLTVNFDFLNIHLAFLPKEKDSLSLYINKISFDKVV